MVKFLALALALSACGDNTIRPAAYYIGSWEYTHGEGRYFCDDGQVGWLNVTPGSNMTITELEQYTMRATYTGNCPNGFTFQLGDESSEGWISQGDECHYPGANAFGHFETTLTNTSDSSLFLRDDDVLVDNVEHVYVFEYEDFTQRCELFTTGYAVRTALR